MMNGSNNLGFGWNYDVSVAAEYRVVLTTFFQFIILSV